MEHERLGGSESIVRGGVRRTWRSTTLTAVILLAAQSSCGLVSDPDTSSSQTNTGSGASAGQSQASGGTLSAGTGGTFSLGTGGTVGTGTGGTLISTGGSNSAGACATDNTLFADQVVSEIGKQRVFYSWTTDEQVAELRADGPLFSRSERPGQGRGLAFTQLADFAAAGTGPERELAAQLESVVFAKVRFTWTNPWATLLGWPGETYGNQLLQIELKPEAWIAVFDSLGVVVYDADGVIVPIETALATPEQIGAIYFQSRGDETMNYCGTFSQGAVGFREFILGNISMVQSWSLATPEIGKRLEDDIATLQAFEAMLACVSLYDPSSWSTSVTCEWSDNYYPGSLLVDYDFSLGIPSELYWPSSENIEALIAALEASMPTGDPLVVTPSG